MTDLATYKPIPGSTAHRVLTLLKRNSLEEYSDAELARMFDGKPGAIITFLATAISCGLIARRKDGQGNVLNIAGPKLSAFDLPTISAAAPPPGTIRGTATLPQFPAPQAALTAKYVRNDAAARAGKRLPMLDVTALHAKPGKPPVGRQCIKGRTRYDELFDKLAEPGLCVELPIAYQASVDKAKYVYARRYPGQRYSVRRINDQTCGIFRTA